MPSIHYFIGHRNRNHIIFAEIKMPKFYIEALKDHRTCLKCKLQKE